MPPPKYQISGSILFSWAQFLLMVHLGANGLASTHQTTSIYVVRNCMKLFFVRHGETVDNARRICQGQLPGALNTAGYAQAKNLASAMASLPLDACISSDLHRAIETSRTLIAPHPQLVIQEDKRLRERHFGNLQGKVMPLSWDGLAPMEGAEPMEAVFARAQDFIQHIQATSPTKNILIVSHGITLMALTAVCLGYTLSQIRLLPLPQNCSMTCFEPTTDGCFRTVSP